MRIWCTIWCRSQLHNSLSWSSCVEKGCFSRIGTSNPWCWFKPFGGVVVPFRSISLDVSLTRLSNGFWWFVGSTMLRSILLVPAWQSSQSTKMKSSRTCQAWHILAQSGDSHPSIGGLMLWSLVLGSNLNPLKVTSHWLTWPDIEISVFLERPISYCWLKHARS